MQLLIHSKPILGETLSSYLQRMATLNYVGPHDLWKLCKRDDIHNLNHIFSAAIDLCPQNSFNIPNLTPTLGVEQDSLEGLTFIRIYKKN